jgi:hypothetical protein
MRRLLVCMLAFGCGMGTDTAASSPDAGPATPAQSAWLTPQNTVRAQAKPTPSPPLTFFTWSDAAAQVAQAWANNCVYEHNVNRGNRGENIAADAPPGGLTVTQVVALWAGEAAFYDYATNTCAAGEDCGHYTQIVWRSTTAVGCGMATCTTGSPFGSGSWDFWVCDYEPPGNFVGQKPY